MAAVVDKVPAGLAWREASYLATTQEAGQDSYLAKPSYVDIMGDVPWLTEIGFYKSVFASRGGILVDPYVEAGGESGGYRVYAPSIAEAAGAVWIDGGKGINPGPPQFVVSPVRQYELATGLRQMQSGQGLDMFVRYVDRSGKPIGRTRKIHYQDNAFVGAIVQVLASAMIAAGVAGVATAAAEGAGLVAPSAEGVSTVKDAGSAFDAGSEAAADAAYDPFSYSSGEASSVATDAANVDYGWGIDDAPIPSTEANSFPLREDFRRFEIATQNAGVTPETLVSDFGVVDSAADFAETIYDKTTTAIGTAVKTVTGATKAVVGAVSGGGVLSPLLKKKKSPEAVPPIRSNVGNSSTAAQAEDVQPTNFWGQLGGDDAISSVAPMALAGALGIALVVYAVRR